VVQPSVEPSVDHVNALAAMLAAGTSFDVHVGDVDVPDSDLSYPYYAVWGAPASPVLVRLKGDGGEVVTRTQITVAALTSLDVIGAADRARRVLHRRRPTIPGRRCGDVGQEPASPSVPVLDPTVTSSDGRRVYVAYLFFTLHSTLITGT
jgi:hypothetical protein